MPQWFVVSKWACRQHSSLVLICAIGCRDRIRTTKGLCLVSASNRLPCVLQLYLVTNERRGNYKLHISPYHYAASIGTHTHMLFLQVHDHTRQPRRFIPEVVEGWGNNTFTSLRVVASMNTYIEEVSVPQRDHGHTIPKPKCALNAQIGLRVRPRHLEIERLVNSRGAALRRIWNSYWICMSHVLHVGLAHYVVRRNYTPTSEFGMSESFCIWRYQENKAKYVNCDSRETTAFQLMLV